MSAQYLKDKAREISYALVRVSFYIKRQDLKARLEKLAFELLEDSAKVSVDINSEHLTKALTDISALDSLVRLGYSIYEIEPVNANILVEQLDELNSAIRQSGKLDEELPNLEDFFSNKPNDLGEGKNEEVSTSSFGSSQGSNSRYIDLNRLENLDSADVRETSKKEENGNFSSELKTSGLNAAMRQSEIANKIKSCNSSGCRLKDIIAEFPNISERTLRYDLQKLCDTGVVERIGNGGPASYYAYKGEKGEADDSVGNPLKNVSRVNN